MERPWASLKNDPMPTKLRSEWVSTLIGLSPVWRRSSTPGVPTYLQTNTLCVETVVVVPSPPPVPEATDAPQAVSAARTMSGQRLMTSSP
jgi:hypothetical protein